MEGFLLLLFLVVGVYGAYKLTLKVNYWTFGENQERREKAKSKADKDAGNLD